MTWVPPIGDVHAMTYYNNSSAKRGAWLGTTFPAGTCTSTEMERDEITEKVSNAVTWYTAQSPYRELDELSRYPSPPILMEEGRQSGKAIVNEDDVNAVKDSKAARAKNALCLR